MLGLVALGGVLVVGVQTLWSPSDDVPTIATYLDWRLACPPAAQKQRHCELSQAIALGGGANLRVFWQAVPRGERLLIVAPFDVLLPVGVGLAVGNQPPANFPYRICNVGGCLAPILIDDRLKADLNGNDTGRIIIAGLDGKPQEFLLSLKGFSQGVAALKAREAQRNGGWGL